MDFTEIQAWFLTEGVIIAKAIGILIVGWIASKLISVGLGKAFSEFSFVTKSLYNFGIKTSTKKIGKFVQDVTFFLLMLFVLIAFFNSLQLEAVSAPLNSFLDEITQYLPNILGAVGLFFLAWAVATVLKTIVIKSLDAANIDSRLGEQAETNTPIAETLANTVYWFVFLFFLPAILGALNLTGLLLPVQDLLNQILSYLPNILGAVIIFVIGWLVAKIIRKITVNILSSVGINKLSEKFGMNGLNLASIIGTLVYTIILIPVIVSALSELQIEAISIPATNMLNIVLASIPFIFASIFIIIVAYAIGEFVSKVVTDLLESVGFDRVLSKIGLQNLESKAKPSKVVGKLLLVFIVLFSVVEAANLIGFQDIGQLVELFIRFSFDVLLGVVIIGIGLYFGNLAHQVVESAHNSKILPCVAKYAIIILSVAMGLRQMGIAEDIINLAFGLALGAAAVAFALAFGLGARDTASKIAEDFYNNYKK